MVKIQNVFVFVHPSDPAFGRERECARHITRNAAHHGQNDDIRSYVYRYDLYTNEEKKKEQKQLKAKQMRFALHCVALFVLS